MRIYLCEVRLFLIILKTLLNNSIKYKIIFNCIFCCKNYYSIFSIDFCANSALMDNINNPVKCSLTIVELKWPFTSLNL